MLAGWCDLTTGAGRSQAGVGVATRTETTTVHTSLVKQQFVVRHSHTILQGTQKLDRSLTDQHLCHVFTKIREAICLWIHDFDRRSVYNPASSYAGISV